jgi:uncharacterized protein (TIGR00369 family)
MEEGDPLSRSPYGSHLGMRLVELEDDRAKVSLDAIERLANTGGLLHGGAICSLVDMAAGTAVSLGAPEGVAGAGTTVSLTIDFLEAVRDGEVIAEATVLRRGKGLCFCDVQVTDAAGQLVAKAQVTYRLSM